MAALVIDIGNTALKAAWCDGMTLGKTFRYQGEKMIDFIISLADKNRPEVMVLSSVRYFSEQNVRRLSEYCDRLVIINESLMSDYDIPLHLSPDRAASIIASRYLFKGRKCSIFDFGAILTIDFIDADGRYEGGNISLGYRTRFKSLNRYSRNLPLADMYQCDAGIGTDTSSAINAGVLSGMIFETQGYLDHYPENVNVFTGGDAIYFAKRMKNSIFVVCNLVLMGLALIAVEYDKKH